MEFYNEIEFYAKVNCKVRVGWNSKDWMGKLFGKLEIHSKPRTLKVRLFIWQDSQDKRSGRSITCFVRKWKEKVAWPRLTKEDIKVGVWEVAAFSPMCSVYPGTQVRSGNQPWLLSHKHSVTHQVLPI